MSNPNRECTTLHVTTIRQLTHSTTVLQPLHFNTVSHTLYALFTISCIPISYLSVADVLLLWYMAVTVTVNDS